jgi:hypothetical protein
VVNHVHIQSFSIIQKILFVR